jgi:hypothetical protein
VTTNEVELVVENEVFNGRERSKLKWVNPLNAKFAFREPATKGSLKQIAAAFRAKHQEPKKTTSTPTSLVAEIGDDDFLF